MKTTFKIAILATALVAMLIADVPLLFEPLVPEAHAVLGVRRRTRRRTAVVVGSAASAETAAAQQQTAAAQQQAAAAEQEAAAAKQEAAVAKQEAAAAQQQAAATGGSLPVGTVVSTLPGGCTPTAINGVEYNHCGSDYYRTAFQGSNLVYVTAKP